MMRITALSRTEILPAKKALEICLHWLLSPAVRIAIHLREVRGELEVSVHREYFLSINAVMPTTYLEILRPDAKTDYKPHARSVLRMTHYRLRRQSLDQRLHPCWLSGALSHSSHAKTQTPVVFFITSVGIDVASADFASLAQDYLIADSQMCEQNAICMIVLIGDTKFEEGNFKPRYCDKVTLIIYKTSCDLRQPKNAMIYLHLTTRSIPHVKRRDPRWGNGALNGSKHRAPSHVEPLLSRCSPNVGLVKGLNGSPPALSLLGGVRRMPRLGMDKFFQTGDLSDIDRTYRIGANAILNPAAELRLSR